MKADLNQLKWYIEQAKALAKTLKQDGEAEAGSKLYLLLRDYHKAQSQH